MFVVDSTIYKSRNVKSLKVAVTYTFFFLSTLLNEILWYESFNCFMTYQGMHDFTKHNIQTWSSFKESRSAFFLVNFTCTIQYSTVRLLATPCFYLNHSKYKLKTTTKTLCNSILPNVPNKLNPNSVKYFVCTIYCGGKIFPIITS